MEEFFSKWVSPKWFILGHFLVIHLQNHLCPSARDLGCVGISWTCREFRHFGNFLGHIGNCSVAHKWFEEKGSWIVFFHLPLAKPLVCKCSGSWTCRELAGISGNFLGHIGNCSVAHKWFEEKYSYMPLFITPFAHFPLKGYPPVSIIPLFRCFLCRGFLDNGGAQTLS